VTDPLAHDVEYVPAIQYKGQYYLLTHSMIYAKFLACHHRGSRHLRGLSQYPAGDRKSDRVQRGKYLIDFSQMIWRCAGTAVLTWRPTCMPLRR